MDPHEPVELAFVSHGHADHFAAHQKTICSVGTGKILAARYGVAPETIEAREFFKPWKFKGHRLCLYPAGHIAGSAMLRVECERESLLYTGDFKTRPSLTVERPVFPTADQLVMETTFGKPQFVFPPQDEVIGQIVNFTRETLADGETPVIFAYSLGKAQEAIAILDRAGLPMVQTRPVLQMTETVRSLGLGDLSEPVLADQEVPEGVALIAPPNAVRSQMIRRLKKKRTAMLSGWALTPGSKFRYQVDEVFALSDHADFPGLLEAVERVQPRVVHTLHGSTREFAARLREQGVEAWSIYGDDQLELLGQEESAVTYRPRKLERPPCELQELTDVLTSLMENASRLKKVALTAEFFRSLEGENLPLIIGWLTGDPVKGLGSALIKQALLDATGLPPATYKTISSQQNDAARTGRLLLEAADLAPMPQDFREVKELFEDLKKADAGLSRAQRLAEMFRECHPQEGETLIRLLSGGLRIGAKEGIFEEAVAEAFGQEASQVRQAVMLSGSLVATAPLARSGELENIQLSPGSPVKAMLASPTETAADLYAWAVKAGAEEGEVNLWLEEKFDGIRAQLHVEGGQASLFSRDLKPLEEFPELIDAAQRLPDCILDGEIIAYAEGKKLTFFDLQKRLGRKQAQGDLFLGASVPVQLIAFDCLYTARETDLIHRPLRERRVALEGLGLFGAFQTLEVRTAENVETIEEHFKTAMAAGQEGLIAKDPSSLYRPGRRGQAWKKLKGVMPTLDCVVIAAQQGHGKRAGVLSDYTFAVRDLRDGTLKTLGKAYSGLTDLEIEDLTEHFQRTTIQKRGARVVEVEPQIVLEIAFDKIRPSKRHDSGLALRFPRIKAIRKDKSLEEIDTLQTAEQLL